MLLIIPPKCSVANAVGFLKSKSAVRIFREHRQIERSFTGKYFWARGYCVNVVGLEEKVIRKCIRDQESEEIRQEQLILSGL